ncbi:N(4)-(beta-N-acetylglucosaminyl)-L-asparaginase [Algoriphagus halophytocola]|uniref:N(4)-(Beta-N-acetylglucosaminyl)-L-asparaginase n=1 Tax=Algoriphagus halophytocola TaxID=2991499 RepID=A0ABY6MFJ8_9BACT|nr:MULTISPECIES: N(4)-(beta-N-acetylglucosaminyl)-L-asparaginase [unclassified Algoriphagus]UZD22413.1 N(4)-(beta-N-acetylglucosaminyl)-L-asparaginase [Algoriphagus sp. TR-M5]WBL43673.1 N(4)-(beta-N-acetylglucosaminyl)-L-asparaginase [Algoriphagus sp. TR-M9]
MSERRKFIKQSLMGSALIIPGIQSLASPVKPALSKVEKPLLLSTWNHGLPANAAAIEKLKAGGSITDAVEYGVRDTENDLSNLSVGLQGLPDREGITTLDASIMNGDGSCGSVAFVRQVKHPISLARMVMEQTPHVMLAGEGARQFAMAEGIPMEKEELSPKAKEAYERWKVKSQYKPVINIENHDTIGMIGMGADGKLSGSCTTSGLAYKMHGRVGDSPIIGAGLYVDDEVGAATATGLGEAIIRVCGSFLIVELMRQGRSPQEACEEAVRRLISKNKNIKDIQAGFLAMNKEGEVGAYAVHPGFNFAQGTLSKNEMIDSNSHFK